MRIRNVIPGTQTFREVEKLYHSAFPVEERIPFRRMALLSLLRPSVALLAYYDGDTFCGFSFTVNTRRYLYINFFAVDPTLRGKGYGSRMAALLRERYPQAAICEVKAPDTTLPTHTEDVQRLRFWERNGFDFMDGAYPITNPHGVKYLVGTTDGSFQRDAYRVLFDHLSMGPGAQLRILKNMFRK